MTDPSNTSSAIQQEAADATNLDGVLLAALKLKVVEGAQGQ